VVTRRGEGKGGEEGGKEGRGEKERKGFSVSVSRRFIPICPTAVLYLARRARRSAARTASSVEGRKGGKGGRKKGREKRETSLSSGIGDILLLPDVGQ